MQINLSRIRRLYTRNGYDFAGRFPQIVEAVSKFKVRSCFIDGEAIVVDERGLSAFDLLRSWRHDHAAVLCAFDLIELDGRDLRSTPIEERKQHWSAYCAGRIPASCSTFTTTVTAQLSSSTPVASAVRASSQSGLAHPPALGARRIG
jgi:ATP-dependent DNA ligase